MYIIEVTGDIVIKDCKHYVLGCACYDKGTEVEKIKDEAHYNNKKHSYEGNLVFDQNRKAVPYAYYVARKGIQVIPPADMYMSEGGAGPAYNYFLDHIESIKQKAQIPVDDSIKDTYYNSLFIECFSALELFISDFVLCMIFTTETYFDRAVSYFKRETETSNEYDEDELETKIRNYFTSNFVFHKFDKIKELFESLDLTYPNNDKELRTFLYKRNNIVHRFAFSNIDRMKVTNASLEDVLSLLREIDRFTSEIII